MRKCGAAMAAALVGLGASTGSAMNIVVTPDSGLAANPAALAAMNRAATGWSSTFTDNITVNISAGLSGNLDPNILGHASPVKLQAAYDFFRGKIVASAAAEGDDGIVAYVPDLAHFSATLPAGVTFSNKFIATKANFKALGYMDLMDLDAVYGATDSTITLNANVAYDYDNSNGVDANKIDFQSLAAHEIGHALGFISSVDSVDFLKSTNASGELVISPLDLFRFQNGVAGKDPSTPAEFTSFPRFLDTGGSAVLDDLAVEVAMSTGTATGDGGEAGHWKDDVYTGHLLGVMDPSMSSGLAEPISANDIRALDLIGYDHVPEPNPLAVVFSIAGGPFVLSRSTRRRSRRPPH